MVIWLIGISAAGKTTVGEQLVTQFRRGGHGTVFLDGDSLREVWADDLGHSIDDRRKNHGRISRLCRMLEQDGIVVVCAALSIFPDLRQWNRDNFRNYFEVFLDVPVDLAKERDTKGVYHQETDGRKRNIVGIDIPFPDPETADMRIKAPEIRKPPADIARSIFDAIQKNCAE